MTVTASQPGDYDDELIFLTTKDVVEKTGLANTTLQRRRASDPTFPKPVVLNRSGKQVRCIRWVKHEIEAWMESKIDAREA